MIDATALFGATSTTLSGDGPPPGDFVAVLAGLLAGADGGSETSALLEELAGADGGDAEAALTELLADELPQDASQGAAGLGAMLAAVLAARDAGDDAPSVVPGDGDLTDALAEAVLADLADAVAEDGEVPGDGADGAGEDAADGVPDGGYRADGEPMLDVLAGAAAADGSLAGGTAAGEASAEGSADAARAARGGARPDDAATTPPDGGGRANQPATGTAGDGQIDASAQDRPGGRAAVGDRSPVTDGRSSLHDQQPTDAAGRRWGRSIGVRADGGAPGAEVSSRPESTRPPAEAVAGVDPAADAAVRAQEAVTRAAGRPAALPPAIQRIADALAELEHTPPPRQLTLELGDVRLRVGLDDTGVRLTLLGGDRSAGQELVREARELLAQQGFDLSRDGEQTARDQQREEQPPLGDPARPDTARGTRRGGLRL